MANRRDGFIKRTQFKIDSIIRATIKLISTHPINLIRIEDIARKAKVSQVTIYNHFKNKNDVIVHAIKKLASDSVEHIQENLNSNLSIEQRLYHHFERAFTQSVHRPQLEKIKEYIVHGPSHELKDYVGQLFASTNEAVARLYQEAVADKLVREDITFDQFKWLLEMYTSIQARFVKNEAERHLVIDCIIRGLK